MNIRIHSVLLFCFSFFLCSFLNARNVYILIHGGVFGKHAEWTKWVQPASPFPKALNKSINHKDIIYPYYWNGKSDYKSQYNAGKKLVSHIQKSYSLNDSLHLVGKCFGGRVAAAVTQELSKQNSPYKIETIIFLAHAISKDFIPSMKKVKKVYNLFSYGDQTQSLFNREIPSHNNIYNILVTINDLFPEHGSLQHPSIALYIPQLIKLASQNKDLTIEFYTYKIPTMKKDKNRIKNRIIDKKFSKALNLNKIKIIHEYVTWNLDKSTDKKPYWGIKFKNWNVINRSSTLPIMQRYPIPSNYYAYK